MKRILSLAAVSLFACGGTFYGQIIGPLPAKTQTPVECRRVATEKRDKCLVGAGSDKYRKDACNATFNKENHMCSGGGSH
jgi:hypothetical protein